MPFKVEQHSCGNMDVECPDCGALFYELEWKQLKNSKKKKVFKCCSFGNLKLHHPPKPPQMLYDLWTQDNEIGRYFRKNAKKFNNNFCMASTKIKLPCKQPKGKGPSYLSVQGEVNHYIGTLTEDNMNKNQFGQLYILDTSHQLNQRETILQTETKISASKYNRPIIKKLMQCIEKVNPFVKQFKTVMDKRKKDSFSTLKLVLKSQTSV